MKQSDYQWLRTYRDFMFNLSKGILDNEKWFKIQQTNYRTGKMLKYRVSLMNLAFNCAWYSYPIECLRIDASLGSFRGCKNSYIVGLMLYVLGTEVKTDKQLKELIERWS